MKILAKLICIAILLTIPVALFAAGDRDNDGQRYDRGWSITGKVVSIDNGRRILDIYDASQRHYTIIAEDAKIYQADKEKRLRDLQEGDTIRVYGREHDDHIVDAETIFRVERDDDRYGYYLENVRFTGTIKKIDSNHDKLEISVHGRTNTVRVTRDTDIYSGRNRRVDVEYLRKNDEVRVEGYKARSGEINATAIYVGDFDRDNGRYDRDSRSMQLRVLREASFFNRKLLVAPAQDNSRAPDTFDLRVPVGVEVNRYGKRISVTEIRTGDIITVEGRWDRNTYVARHITVNDRDTYGNSGSDRGYRVFRGQIRKINYDRREFTLDTDEGLRTVNTDQARVWVNGDIRSLRDLRRGMQVEVRGNVDGTWVGAERVEAPMNLN